MVSLVRFFLQPKISTSHGHIDRIAAGLAGSGNRIDQTYAAGKFLLLCEKKILVVSFLCLLTSSPVSSPLLSGITMDSEPVEENLYDLGVELRAGATA